MPHSSTPIAVIGLSICCGILLREFFAVPFLFLFLVGSAGFLVLGHIKRWTFLFWVSTVSCFICLGMMRHNPVTETLSTSKSLQEITVINVLKTTPSRQQVLVELRSRELVLWQPKRDLILTLGDRFLIQSALTPIEPPKNATDFDFKTYMRRKGVSRKLDDFNLSYVVLAPKRSMFRWAHQLQKKLVDELQKTPLHPSSKALIMALILGDKHELSADRIEQYQRAGAMHLLAISGLHVGVLLFLLRFLCAPLRRFRYGGVIAACLPIVILWCFVFITGGAASVTRAVTMFSFLQMGITLQRKNASIHGVWASFVVLLIIQPRFLFDVGFQLSYCAVLGIVWMMPYWQQLFANKSLVVRYISSLFGLGCIAQLSVLPLSLFYFHQFPFLFWISNLILVPFLGLLILLGVGCLVLSFFPSLYSFFFIVDGFFTSFQFLVGWIAQWEDFFITHIPFRLSDALFLGAVEIAFFVFVQHPKKRKAIVLGMLSVVFHAQLYWTWSTPPKVVVAHIYKNSLVMDITTTSIVAYIGEKTPAVEKLTQQAQQYYRKDSIVFLPIQKTYKNFLVVDSLGVYKNLNPYTTVLLRDNPQIHLEDLIERIRPKYVLADGSNYPSLIRLWKKTCEDKEVIFHATPTQGAYSLN